LFQGLKTRKIKVKDYYVYILTNNSKTIYIGVTNNLVRRIYGHKNKLIDGFSKKYNLTKLVYFEIFNNINDAIKREKQLKNWHRQWKINLIELKNKEWIDLYNELIN
jgi:putative endonuclease